MCNSLWKFATEDGQTIAEATIQSRTAYADCKARLELSKKTSVESWKAICETVQRLLYYRGRKQLSACSTDLAHVGGTYHCSTKNKSLSPSVLPLDFLSLSSSSCFRYVRPTSPRSAELLQYVQYSPIQGDMEAATGDI